MSASNRGDCLQGTPCSQRMNQTAMPFPPTQQFYCRSPAGFPRLIAWYRSACAASLSPAGTGKQALPLAGPTFRKVAPCLSRRSSPERLHGSATVPTMSVQGLGRVKTAFPKCEELNAKRGRTVTADRPRPRFLPWVHDGEALVRIRVKDTRLGQPVGG
jgi:hypothetical protein